MNKGFCSIGIMAVCTLALFAGAIGAAAQQATPRMPPETAAPSQDAHAAQEVAAERQALGFLGYLDHGRYADSYAYTGMLIRAQTDEAAFAAQIEKARAGTGALQSRELMDANYTTSVQGAPEGQYVVLHYHASFANRTDTVETVVLALSKGYWRVSGYYIK